MDGDAAKERVEDGRKLKDASENVKEGVAD